MIEHVIYSDKGGCGIVTDGEPENHFIEKSIVTLHGTILHPDSDTTLDGRFSRPIRYCGVLKDDNTAMCFHTGVDFTTGKSYYYIYFWINEKRIVNKYAEHSARDFNWVNGKWK